MYKSTPDSINITLNYLKDFHCSNIFIARFWYLRENFMFYLSFIIFNIARSPIENSLHNWNSTLQTKNAYNNLGIPAPGSPTLIFYENLSRYSIDEFKCLRVLFIWFKIKKHSNKRKLYNDRFQSGNSRGSEGDKIENAWSRRHNSCSKSNKLPERQIRAKL